MFKFIEEITDSIVENLEKYVQNLKKEVALYEEVAKNKEKDAQNKEEEAKLEELRNYTKSEEYEETDEQGNTTIKTREIEDLEAEVAAKERADELRKEAAKLRTEAIKSEALARKIDKDIEKLEERIKKIKQVIQGVKDAGDKVTGIITDGGNLIAKTFNLPIINKDKINAETQEREPETFEEAKQIAKDKYANYINSQDGYTDDEKQVLIDKYNNAIDNMEVLSDDEFDAKFGNFDETKMVAIYNGPQDKAYIRASQQTSVHIIIHEVGGHGTGSLIPDEYHYYDDAGVYKHYSILSDKSTNRHAVNEAATELLAQRVSGNKIEKCAYNTNADTLDKICASMSRYGICDGYKLLNDTYTGEDKEQFSRKYNEIMEDDKAYETLINIMQNQLNQGGERGYLPLDIISVSFNKHCENYSKKNNTKGE